MPLNDINNRAEQNGYKKGQLTADDKIINKGRNRKEANRKKLLICTFRQIYVQIIMKESKGFAVTRTNTFNYQFTICFGPDRPSSGDR